MIFARKLFFMRHDSLVKGGDGGKFIGLMILIIKLTVDG
jgi:hypothetical protein